MGSPEHFYSLREGARLADEYVIESILGYGGFGITYLAIDEALESRVAIKEYLPSDLAARDSTATVRPLHGEDRDGFESGMEAFLREARLVARLEKHPNIVAVRRFFRENGTAYMVMDYVEGQPLDDVIGRHLDGMPAPMLQSLLDRLLDGLQTVHAAGALHRDIKASNIIMRTDGQPVLIDFGSARKFAGAATRTMTAMVSQGYAPIEQYTDEGDQGPYTDLYALAAVAYKAITLQTPPESLRRIRRDPMVPAAQAGAGRYPVALLEALDRALAVEPQDRFQTAAEMRAALQVPALRSPPRGDPVGHRASTAKEGDTGKRRPFLAIAVLLLVGAGIAVWSVSRPDFGGQPAGATEIVVDVGGKGAYRSIGQALQTAPPGATLRIVAGTYRESITLDKPVSLVAQGDVQISPPGDWCMRVTAANGVVVQGLKFQAKPGTCLRIGPGSATLDNVQVGGSPTIGAVLEGAATVNRLVVEGAAQYGLVIASDSTATVRGATVRSSGVAGILVHERASPEIADSIVTDSRGSGIVVAAEARPRINGNKFEGSAFAAIEVIDRAQPEVRKNQITGGKQAGVFVHGNAAGTFEENQISKTALSGIVVEGGEPLFRGNHVSEAGEHGIYVSGAAKPKLEQNTVTRSSGHGLAADGTSSAQASRNTFVANRQPQIARTNSAEIQSVDNTVREN